MKMYTCFDMDDDAKHIAVGGECPVHVRPHHAHIDLLDFGAWEYGCTAGCLHAPLPDKVAVVDVHVSYMRKLAQP